MALCETQWSCVANGEEITPLIEIEIHLWSLHDGSDKCSTAKEIMCSFGNV